MSAVKKSLSLLDRIAFASLENMGNVLIVTSILAWVLSSGAHLIGIHKNKEYSKDQKKFMMRQELADALTNIGLYFLVTKSLVALSSKAVSTGKLATRSIVDHLSQHNLLSQRGKFDFDIKSVPKFDDIRQSYTALKCFSDSAAAITGGIVSSNVITPLVRDYYAAKRQNKPEQPNVNQPQPYTPVINTPRHTFDDFRRTALGI